MAFLSEDSWKTGLNPQQLNKIALVEKQRDGFKNELAKKSYNHDILQQGLDKEKRKVGPNKPISFLSNFYFIKAFVIKTQQISYQKFA